MTLMVCELLEEESDVIAAHCLANAKLALPQHDYDLVILDIGKNGSGLEKLPLLRRDGHTPPAYVV